MPSGERDTFIQVEIEAEGCAVETFLNGIPVGRAGGDEPHFRRVPVDPFVVPKSNRLELVVEHGSTPSRSRDERRELPLEGKSARARLVRYHEGELGGGGERLCEVVYPALDFTQGKQPPRVPPVRGFKAAEAAPVLEVFPQTLTSHTDLGPANGAWAWQSAAPLSLDQALVEETEALLADISAGITEGDVDRIWSICELQIAEFGRAFPAVTAEVARADLEGRLGENREKVLPRSRARYDFRVVAGGRLLQLIDLDWSPTFKLAGKRGKSVGWNLFVARIDNALRVAR